MRKLLSLLLVVVMLFGLATTALAYTDVTTTAQKGPVEKLSALGIIKGYADGTFKPENPITRAEFAAVIVRMLGLEEAAKLINTPTKFSDVTANYAWAYGYINIASARGIIKGDPGGKFRPADKVSFAEAITMLLRAGGWDAACSTMDWPAGFVMKAVEFGITDDVTFDANAPANRGVVAVMTYNTLWTPMARWDDTAKIYSSDHDTVAWRYLKAVEHTTIVWSVPNTDATLKPNQLATIADDEVFVPTGTNANALLGREVRVIKVGSDKYVYIADVTPTDRIITGVTFVGLVGQSLQYTDGTDNSIRTLAPAGFCYRNYAAGQLNQNCALTLFLNEYGEIRFILANEWDHEQYIVAAKYLQGVDGAPINYFEADCGCLFEVLANTVFMKDGKPATYADLAVGDVFYAQTKAPMLPGQMIEAAADDTTYVELYSAKVSGKVGAVALNAKGEAVLTVNGTNCVVDNEAFNRDYVELDDSALAKTDIGRLVNFDVTLKLNATGKAIVVTGTTTALIGKVTAIDDENDKLTVSVKGVSNTYVHLAACEAAADALVKGDYVAMTQRADGKITSIAHFHLSDAYTVKAVDTTNRALTLSLNGTLSIVKYTGSAFGVRLGTWGDVSLLKTGDEIAFHAGLDGKILYFEVNPSVAGSVYGKYIGSTAIEGTEYIYVNVKGEVKTYESEVLPGVAAGNIVKVTLDSVGVVTAIADVAWDASAPPPAPAYVFSIKATSGSLVTVERSSDHAIQVHDASATVVYKTDGTLGSLADLEVNAHYIRVMNGTDMVVIQLVP